MAASPAPTTSQWNAIDEWIGSPHWFQVDDRIYRLLGNQPTDVTVTATGNVRLGARILVRPDGTSTPIR